MIRFWFKKQWGRARHRVEGWVLWFTAPAWRDSPEQSIDQKIRHR